ncbi:MAG: branched-chain amino acid ABC transporter permease [Nitrososphaerota archaeon]|nr:branched-chain amino acid ABC transporter permease [Nitrososphaerota archaeon]
MTFGLPIINLFGLDMVSFTIDLGIFFSIYLIVTLSLNLEMGYAGVPNFGKLLFVAGGSSVASTVAGRLAVYILHVNTFGNYSFYSSLAMQKVDTVLQASPLLSIGVIVFSVAVGGAVGGAFGYIASFPAIRLKEDYLAMLLLAAAQFFTIFLAAYPPLIGGYQPIAVPDPFLWAGTGRDVRDLLALAVVAVFAVLVYLYVERVARSPMGRALRAVRDNETASEAVGKDNVALRNRSLVIASVLCGAAGALFSLYLATNGQADWSVTGRLDWTIVPWIMVIIGGVGNNLGVAVGTLVFTFLIRLVTQGELAFGGLSLPMNIVYKGGTYVIQYMPFNVDRIEYIIVGLALIVVLYLRPDGLIPEKSTFTMKRSKLLGMAPGPPAKPQQAGGPPGDGGGPRALKERLRRIMESLRSSRAGSERQA